MIYHLFLDDTRNPKDVTWIDLPLHNWVIVRNYEQFVETILKNGVPTTVSFDHDLANEHYQEYTIAHDPHIGESRIRYEKFKEKTGYDCAKWLANYCIDHSYQLPLYYVHTLNPIGFQNIVSTMENARLYFKTFTIPDVTPEEKEAFRQRMRERKLKEQNE